MGVQRAYISNLELCRKEPKLSTVIRYADILGIDLATLFTGCPASDGSRELPSVAECRKILRRVGVKAQDLRTYFFWSERWRPEDDGEWGLADELLWLETLLRLNLDKWKQPVARQALGRLATKQAKMSGEMNLFGEEEEDLL